MSLEAAAKTALIAANPYMAPLMIGATALQGIAAYNNAKFQSKILLKEADAKRSQTTYNQAALEINAEQNRLNAAITERKKIQKYREVNAENIAANAAGGSYMDENIFESKSLSNLTDELSVLFLEKALIKARAKGSIANLNMTSEREIRVLKSKASLQKAVGNQALFQSAVSMVGIGAEAGYFDTNYGGNIGNIDMSDFKYTYGRAGDAATAGYTYSPGPILDMRKF